MPSKHKAGKCGSCCGVCVCNGSLWGTMHVTISDVAMNATPLVPECLSPHFGEIIDETWFNGVTFIFNPEWLNAEVAANNPNDADEPGGVQCVSQGARWICAYELAAPGGTNKEFVWLISVLWQTIDGHFTVDVELACSRFTPDVEDVSKQRVRYTYDGECPTGSYSETTRTFGTNENNGAFDFTGFNATLAWVP